MPRDFSCSSSTGAAFSNLGTKMAGTAEETLGGVAIELLGPLERAAGSGDAQAMTALLGSSAVGAVDHNAAESRPLRRTILHCRVAGHRLKWCLQRGGRRACR